jgi:DNA modification methylase
MSIIFDGTTAIACLNTNRNYIGFELDKTYFDMANKRIEEHIAQMSRQEELSMAFDKNNNEQVLTLF